MRSQVLLALSLCASGCASATSAGLDLSSRDAVQSRLTIPQGHEAQRESFVNKVLQAQSIVTTFAEEHGWQRQAAVQNFDRIVVFSTQAELWSFVLEIHGLPATTEMRGNGPVAAPEGRVLSAVVPEEFARIEPQYAARPDSWARLIAHEMGHRFHIVILEGDADAMGPLWFFEGFAVLCAGQTIDEGLVYNTADEALAGAHDRKSPNSYRRFAAATRYFASKVPLPELVARASDPSFEDWLRTRAK